MFTITRWEQFMLILFFVDFAMKIGLFDDKRTVTGALFSIIGIYGVISLKIRNGSILALLLYWICFLVRYINLVGFCNESGNETTSIEASKTDELTWTMSTSDSAQGGIVSYIISWIIFFMYLQILVCIYRVNMYWYIYPHGLYGVGHKETIIKDDEYSITVSWFYPTDSKHYMEGLNDDSKFMKWNIDGDKFLQGLSIARSLPKIFFRDLNIP